MAVALSRRAPPAVAPRRASAVSVRRSRLKADWPFTWLFLGFPLWWALGLGSMIHPVFATVMAVQMLQRRDLRLPRGFGWWLFYVIWVLGSAMALNQGTPIAYVFRLLMYLSITVMFVWVYNMPRDVLPTSKVLKVLVSFFFIVLAGGWLGVLLPGGGFTSPMEVLLPTGLATNSFVHDLIHPAFAQVQDFLGYPLGRPKAPFVYTNDWGSVYALLCPLFFAVWLQDPRRRLKGYVILGLSLVPVFLSLNRGLWLSLGVALLYAGTRTGPIGSFARKALASLAIIGVSLLVFTPLKTVVEDRATHGHSNQGREYLYVETWDAVKRSPFIGYGGPLPVDKSRILPAIGTQGQLWNVMISQGLVGTVLFVGFLVRMAWATRRGPSITFWSHVVLIVALVQLPVYDMMPTPLHLTFVVVAMGLRELHQPDKIAAAARQARSAALRPTATVAP